LLFFSIGRINAWWAYIAGRDVNLLQLWSIWNMTTHTHKLIEELPAGILSRRGHLTRNPPGREDSEGWEHIIIDFLDVEFIVKSIYIRSIRVPLTWWQ
jgi:hypothetical protein